MRDKKACNTFVLSIVAIILSVISVLFTVGYACVEFPNTNELNFDYMGIIISILSILVTVLLGWNIYTLIDLRRSKEYIDDKLSDYDHEISGGLYQAMGISKFDQGQHYDALFFFMNGIREQNDCSKQVYTDNLINYILRIKNSNAESLKGTLNEETFEKYKSIIEDCKCKNSIKREIEEYLNSIQTKSNDTK